MKYRFKFGRGQKVIISDNKTFDDLGYAILKKYGITPEHLYSFRFSNGECTTSAMPFGFFGGFDDGMGTVPIETKLKDRKMEIGEVLILAYDYASDWEKKIKLDGFE